MLSFSTRAHQHLADEQRAGYGRDDDESQTCARLVDRREGRVLKGKLVGWNVDALLRRIEQARERILARINGTPKLGRPPRGNNSFADPYRPNFPRGMLRQGSKQPRPRTAEALAADANTVIIRPVLVECSRKKLPVFVNVW